MAKKKTGALDKVSDVLKDAANTVNEKVVKPAAEALGLSEAKKKPTKAAARKGGASKAAKSGAAKKKAGAAKGGAARKKSSK